MKPDNYCTHAGYFLLVLFCYLQLTSCQWKSLSAEATQDGAEAGKDSVSFLVVGDWGKQGGEYQKQVAEAMNRCGLRHRTSFIISTGDNFYPSGVRDTADAHWQSSFEKIYDGEGHQVDWYAVLGNHDYEGNPQAQLAYSIRGRRWRMPSRYYALRKEIDAGSAILFLFTDTSPLIEDYHDRGMADLSKQDTAAQLSWLRQTLAASKDKWKIVIGHHPIYSAGAHGNTLDLIHRLKPAISGGGTDFYLSGHDHSLQYLARRKERMAYLVSGGGSESTPLRPHFYSRFARSSPGFLVMTLYAHKANFYFYDNEGLLLYRGQVIK
ncbi:MAG TPA: tartrate-resistant acid phosphatase type 5 family protein [Flavisolibacter sp.]|nr:tartrate-resistant acid phosphatase type 5 family protein [Flavisolibacter sp.]